MPVTYNSLATTTVSTAVTTITFSSIPSGYTDLVLIVSNAKVNDSSGAGLYVYFNGDTAANYAQCAITGNGSSVAGSAAQNVGNGLLAGLTDVSTTGASFAIVNIMSYSNTTNRKTVLSQSSNSITTSDMRAVVWYGTAAINTIRLDASSGFGRTFNAGTTATIYGILRA
jgi:hypothetical protein